MQRWLRECQVSEDQQLTFDEWWWNSQFSHLHTDAARAAWEASAAQWQTEVKNLRAALIAVMPFVDDALDVQQLFPNSAASNACRAAVAAANAVLGRE